MKHVLSVERDNGTFPEVGTNARRVVTSTRPTAVRIATEWSRRYQRRVRVQSYADDDFYKPDAMPLTTIVGISVLKKFPPATHV